MKITKSIKMIIMLARYCIICSVLIPRALFADEPWFTGPILAPSGVNVAPSVSYVDLYTYYLHSEEGYNRHGRLVPTSAARSVQFNGAFSHGITDWLDMEIVFPYIMNKHQTQSHQGIGDVQALLGLQLFAPPVDSKLPNIRCTIMETIPTGRYEQLSPSLLGADGTGAGSYQTTLNLIFQRIFEPFTDHYLQSRLVFGLNLPSSVQLNSITSFGGVAETSGRLKPGISNSIDLSGEFSINQHLAVVMEAFYFADVGNNFVGCTRQRSPW